MPITWESRGAFVAVRDTGLVANEEIGGTLDRLLAASGAGPGARVLWDSRGSETPLSGDDAAYRLGALIPRVESGALFRLALLLRRDQGATIEILRSEVPKALPGLQFGVFTEESEAEAWLEACD